MKANLHQFTGYVQPLTAKAWPYLPVYLKKIKVFIMAQASDCIYPIVILIKALMKTTFTNVRFHRKPAITLITGLFVLLVSLPVSAQLGVYSFTGSEACPNQNPSVTSQPPNAVFNNYSSVNTSCKKKDNVFNSEDWNTSTSFDSTEYNQFTITANVGYALNLTSITFTQYTDENDAQTKWTLRSSLDNFSSDLGTGTATATSQTPTVNLPPAAVSPIAPITFR